MAVITDMQWYTFIPEYDGYRAGQEIRFYYPLTADKGLSVKGTLTRIVQARDLKDDVYFRVRDESNIECDYPFGEIVLPDDVERNPFEVRVKVVLAHPNARMPEYATPGSSGFDLVATGDHLLEPLKAAVIGTGLKFEIPEGYELQVRGRSGLGKRGIGIANGIGTIDSDYRGEVGVIMINYGPHPYQILAGDKVAQGVVVPVSQARLIESESLSETERGEGGFGSSGR